MTGLHGIHVTVGIGILSGHVSDWRGAENFPEIIIRPSNSAGLYWHFVDIVWLFLYPLLYLVQRHT